MVGSATSLTGKGLRDWLLQRVSAVVLIAFVFTLLVFFIKHPQVDYATWHGFMTCEWMRIFTLLALINVIIHAWIGVWTVTTDYLKSTCLRLIVHSLVFLSLIAFFAWGIAILWGA